MIAEEEKRVVSEEAVEWWYYVLFGEIGVEWAIEMKLKKWSICNKALQFAVDSSCV